jgi:hypothetical protein
VIFRRWPTLPKAIFDLAHLESLSDEPSLAFLISPRSAYVLQNLGTEDAADHTRYATELVENGYIQLEEDEDDYDLFASVVDGVWKELIPMPTWLNQLPRLYQAPGNLLDVDEPVSAAFLVDPRGICDWYAVLSVNENATAGAIDIEAQTPPESLEFLAGRFVLLDAGSQFYEGAVVHVGSSHYRLLVDAAADYVGVVPAITLADGDIIWLHCRYRCEVS